MKQYVYKVRRVALKNSADVVEIGKRCIIYWQCTPLLVGGLYFLRELDGKQGCLFRVESIVDVRECA